MPNVVNQTPDRPVFGDRQTFRIPHLAVISIASALGEQTAEGLPRIIGAPQQGQGVGPVTRRIGSIGRFSLNCEGLIEPRKRLFQPPTNCPFGLLIRIRNRRPRRLGIHQIDEPKAV